MARKRMFDSEIINQDSFLDLPMEAKGLYFLLGMEADDEGFVSYKRVIRLFGGTEDSIKLLAIKKYIIIFESGVVVITDWKRNNYLDKNKIKKTIYEKEKKLLDYNPQTQKYQWLNQSLTEVKLKLTESLPRVEESRVEENRIDECSNKAINNINNMGESCEDSPASATASESCEDSLLSTSESCEDGLYEPDLSEIINFYCDNIGMATPYSASVLAEYLHEGTTKDLIILAIKKAVESNVRTIKYIKGILNSWKNKNIKTVVEVQQEEEQYRSKKASKNEEQRNYSANDLENLYANGG